MTKIYLKASIIALIFTLNACSNQNLTTQVNSEKPKSLQEMAASKTPISSLSTIKQSKQPVFKKSVELTYVNEKGALVPITPEMLKSIEIVSKDKPNTSGMKISSFGIKDTTGSQGTAVAFESGGFTLVSNSFAELNNIIAKFNLVNSTNPIVVPIIANLYGASNDKVKAVIDQKTGATTISYLDSKGEPNNKLPSLVLQGGKLSVISKDSTGKAEKSEEFNLDSKEPDKSVVNTNIPNAISDILNMSNNIRSLSNQSIFGQWKFSGLGQNILLSITSESSTSFKASAMFEKNNYEGTSNTSSGDPKKGYTISAKHENENLKIKLIQTKDDSINLSLVEAPDNSKLKGFLNLPFNLTRLGSTPISPTQSELINPSVFANKPITQVVTLGAESPFLNTIILPSPPAPPPFDTLGSALNNLTRVQFVQVNQGNALLFANGSIEASITSLYQTTFGRNPEAGSMDYWFDLARSGASLNQIANAFTRSSEFSSMASLSDRDFIQKLYQNTFNRAGEDSGIDYWVDVLKNGSTRVDVILQFSNSNISPIDTLGAFGGRSNTIGSVSIVSGII